MRSPILGTLVYLLAGSLWLLSLGRHLGTAAWPLLLFSAVLVHALFRHALAARDSAQAGLAAAVLEALPGAVIVTGRDGSLLAWNGTAQRLCGLGAHWHGRAVADAFAAEDAPHLQAAAGLRPGAQHGFVARLMSGDGHGLTFRWSAAAAPDAPWVVLSGEPVGGDLQSALHDAVDRVGELVAVVSGERVAYLNRSGARMLGGDQADDLIGRPWAELCSEPAQAGSGRLRRLDGAMVDARLVQSPILFQGRRALLVQARDVTEGARAAAAADNERRSREALLDAVAEAVLILDGDGRILGHNRSAAEMFGADRLDGAAQRLRDLVTKPEAGPVDATRAGGRGVSAELSFVPLPSAGAPLRAAILRDTSRERELQNRVLIAETVLDCTVEGVMVIDTRGAIKWVNGAFCTISGFERDEVLGKNVSLLKSGMQEKEFYRALWQEVRDAGKWEGEIWNRRKDGEAYLEWLTIKAVKDEAGTITNFVGVFSDISRNRRAEETIRHLTYYDAVTRLPNRYLFRDRVAQALERAQRSGRLVALAMVGLARFKQVNETLGHGTGDALLREVAERLTRSVRGQDTVARLRGDTFCCVLTDLNQAEDALPVVNRILEAFATSFLPNGHELFATANLGIGIYPIDGGDLDDLVQKAETAMNRSREKADNSYHFYTPEMNANSMERLRLETDLRKAVGQGELVLYYQPKVAAGSGRMVGAEALVRWQHREFGMISPAKFIPIAEETGLILPVGNWVLEAACRQIREWQAAGLPPQRIAINLSAVQFRQPDLVETVVRVLEQTGVSADLIELELTESAVMHNADIAVRRMLDLHEAGIRLAIDDFGTGYSSLAHLKRFPLDKLKIDRSFVQDLGSSPAGEEIVGAIIAMAHSLNLSVVAEGVETEQQLDLLRALRCDEIQGFYFSPPVPAPRFEEMLRTGVVPAKDGR